MVHKLRVNNFGGNLLKLAHEINVMRYDGKAFLYYNEAKESYLEGVAEGIMNHPKLASNRILEGKSLENAGDMAKDAWCMSESYMQDELLVTPSIIEDVIAVKNSLSEIRLDELVRSAGNELSKFFFDSIFSYSLEKETIDNWYYKSDTLFNDKSPYHLCLLKKHDDVKYQFEFLFIEPGTY